MNLTEEQKSNPALTGALLGLSQGSAVFGGILGVILLLTGAFVGAVIVLTIAAVGLIVWKTQYDFGFFFTEEDFRRE